MPSEELALTPRALLFWQLSLGALIIFGVAANALTWRAIMSKRELRQASAYYLVRLIALFDALSSLGAIGDVLVPNALAVLWDVWLTPLQCALISQVVNHCSLLSVNGQLILALNRLVAVYWPLRYRLTTKRTWTLALVAVAWPAVVFFVAPIFHLLARFTHTPYYADCFLVPNDGAQARALYELLAFSLFFLPATLGIGMYVAIFLRLRLHSSGSVASHAERIKRAHGSLPAFLSFVTYALTMITMSVMTIRWDLWSNQPIVYYAGLYFYRLNFAINPVFYYFANKQMRAAYRETLSRTTLTIWQNRTSAVA